jgi:hypothetical protein
MASATGRDRNPLLTRLLTGRATIPWDEPVQDGTALRRPPSLKTWERSGEHRQAHRMRNLGSDVLGGGTRLASQRYGLLDPPATTDRPAPADGDASHPRTSRGTPLYHRKSVPSPGRRKKLQASEQHQ